MGEISAIARQSDAPGSFPQARNRIVLGPRNEEDGAVILSGKRRDEHVQADCEGERLMGLLAAERNELVRCRRADEHVAIGDLAHRHIRDEGTAVGTGDRERERVRARERRPATRRAEARRRCGGQRSDEPTVSEPSHPVAEKARRETLRGDDEAGPGRRICKLGLDEVREDQIPERAVSLPPFVAGLGGDLSRLSLGVEVGQGAEPRDP